MPFTTPVSVREGRGENDSATLAATPVTRTGTGKLPDHAPDAHARAYLRRLYEAIGSKNEVLRQVWGGVVNAEGKTPKTKRWLDEALTEMVT